MKTDREREAGQLRAEGDEEKARITATADREVAVFKADAGLKAQVTMGGADAEATKIYADAFNRDKDFYGFYRRMEAYKQAFGSGGSTMILSPDTDFFRYFNDASGTRMPPETLIPPAGAAASCPRSTTPGKWCAMNCIATVRPSPPRMLTSLLARRRTFIPPMCWKMPMARCSSSIPAAGMWSIVPRAAFAIRERRAASIACVGIKRQRFPIRVDSH
jgi:hypothetical protein